MTRDENLVVRSLCGLYHLLRCVHVLKFNCLTMCQAETREAVVSMINDKMNLLGQSP